jgi:multimeric flavodoxin WrbA
MKVVAFNGSARKKGNTRLALETALAELQAEGIDTELVSLAGKNLHGCRACFKCFEKQNKHCALKDDDINELIDKMLEADGIIIGSPVYFASMTTETKALIDRAGIVAKGNSEMFSRKVGASIAVARRAGAVATFDEINRFFFISGMIVPGSTYWNVGMGRAPGDVQNDEEGMATFRNLGKNMAWLLKKLHA